MTYSSSVLYPVGAKFDMDYYVKKHMPLVFEKWSPYGLKSWKVVELSYGLNGTDLDTSKTQYSVQAILEWESKEGMEKGIKTEPESKVFDDVKNFTDAAPIFITGAIVGSSA